MLDNIQIGYNTNIDNFFNQFHPFSKLLCMLIMSSIIGISTNIILLLIIFFFIGILMILSKVPKEMYFKVIGNIKLLLILTFLTTYLFHKSVMTAEIMVLKFILLVLLGSIYLYTTKISDMTEGISLLISPLRIFKVNTTEISLIIILTIRFIPVVIDIAKKMIKSLECRGFNYYGSFVNKVKSIPFLLYPIIIKTIYSTTDFSSTLLMRTVDFEKNKKLEMSNWRKKDTTILVLVSVILLYLIRNEVLG